MLLERLSPLPGIRISRGKLRPVYAFDGLDRCSGSAERKNERKKERKKERMKGRKKERRRRRRRKRSRVRRKLSNSIYTNSRSTAPRLLLVTVIKQIILIINIS